MPGVGRLKLEKKEEHDMVYTQEEILNLCKEGPRDISGSSSNLVGFLQMRTFRISGDEHLLISLLATNN